MLIFIDESGDVGFKIQNGSSRHFVICCVDSINLEMLDNNILSIKYAFKYKKTTRV